MNLDGKKFLVVGTGISGIAAAELLVGQGLETVLYDGNPEARAEELREKSPMLGQVELKTGQLPEETLAEYDIAVFSPGVPTDIPLALKMRELGIEIWGEIELAYAFEKGRVLAVTGTNGKTTTTALLGSIMEHAGLDVKVVGNIGIPYTSMVTGTGEDSVTVAEISSFQLETVHKFCPQVSAILNITPDHLNRHHTMENYQKAKEQIAANQGPGQFCILNYEDERTREFGENIAAKVLYFSSQRKIEQGIYLEDGKIIYKYPDEVEICSVDELRLLGLHNYENYMAAIAMAAVYGVPFDVIRKAVKEFQGVEHRIEYVTEKKGVAYYNDSKGTNPDAAIKGIQAMNRPTVLIGGGYDKDSVYTEWINSFEGKVKRLVLVAATKEKIARDARTCGFYDYVFADTFEEAVLEAAKAAKPGDAVLLSPACASWGMFPNYEVRGEKFKEIVNSL